MTRALTLFAIALLTILLSVGQSLAFPVTIPPSEIAARVEPFTVKTACAGKKVNGVRVICVSYWMIHVLCTEYKGRYGPVTKRRQIGPSDPRSRPVIIERTQGRISGCFYRNLNGKGLDVAWVPKPGVAGWGEHDVKGMIIHEVAHKWPEWGHRHRGARFWK